MTDYFFLQSMHWPRNAKAKEMTPAIKKKSSDQCLPGKIKSENIARGKINPGIRIIAPKNAGSQPFTGRLNISSFPPGSRLGLKANARLRVVKGLLMGYAVAVMVGFYLGFVPGLSAGDALLTVAATRSRGKTNGENVI